MLSLSDLLSLCDYFAFFYYLLFAFQQHPNASDRVRDCFCWFCLSGLSTSRSGLSPAFFRDRDGLVQALTQCYFRAKTDAKQVRKAVTQCSRTDCGNQYQTAKCFISIKQKSLLLRKLLQRNSWMQACYHHAT